MSLETLHYTGPRECYRNTLNNPHSSVRGDIFQRNDIQPHLHIDLAAIFYTKRSYSSNYYFLLSILVGHIPRTMLVIETHLLRIYVYHPDDEADTDVLGDAIAPLDLIMSE